MDRKKISREQWLLLAGDAVVLGTVTVFGFRFHQMSEVGAERMLATFAPWLAGWVLAGVPLGVFNADKAKDGRELWRVLGGMGLGAPLAGLLRGLWLSEAVPPVFVLVMGGTSALALLIWRAAFWLGSRKLGAGNG